MTIVYRTDGVWGAGKGSNLSPAEVDGNFHDVDTRVTTIEDNPVEPIAPIAINIEGSAFTMGLSNGDTLGPIAITYPMPTWRGNWAPSIAYHEMDFFIAPDGGLGAVMVPHTSAATFDWAADDGATGLAVYRTLIGSSGSTLALDGLTDVTLTSVSNGQLLTYDATAGFWKNTTSGSGTGTVTSVATGAGLTGGPVTTTGTIAFATVANDRVLANISGSTAAPSANTMTGIIDAVFGSTRGSLLYRGSGGWAALAPGTDGTVLTTHGTAADPAWAAAAGGGGASISIGDTAPASPTAGALWWDSVGGQLYLWYNDGSSSQWVPSSNQPGPTGATGAAGPGISGTAGYIPYFNTSTTISDSVVAQSGGNVGIGTTGPTAKLQVNGTFGVGAAGQVAKAQVSGSGQLTSLIDTAGNLDNALLLDDTQAAGGAGGMILFSGGSTVWRYAAIKGVTISGSGNSQGAIAFSTRPTATDAALTEAMRIDYSGNLGIGTASPGATRLNVVQNQASGWVTMIQNTHTTAGDNCLALLSGLNAADTTSKLVSFWDAALLTAQGAITRNGAAAVAYGTTSDERLKEAVTDSSIGLSELLQLKVRDYNYKQDDRKEHGLIAQEVQTIYPLAVHEGGDDPNKEPWMIDYGRLTPLLIKSIQQQQEEITLLRDRLAALEGGEPAPRGRH